MPSSEPSLECRNLSKSFGQFVALDHLTLRLEGAKCVGFLGPNGAGKTTTLKLLTDMIFPTTGECFIDGIAVRDGRREALRRAGVLIETPEVYPSLTPHAALRIVCTLRGIPEAEREERIHESLTAVKMQEWADKKVGKFSKGMKQRVNVAAALVHDPRVLILDEPATGLDPRGMAEIRAIVRELKRTRLVFMSSHILQEVTDVCDEVALIDKGKLLFHDTLPNVVAKFGNGGGSFEVELAKEKDPKIVAQALLGLPGVTNCIPLSPVRFKIVLSKDANASAGLLEAVVALHIDAVSVSRSESALEEIYLSRISRGD